MFKDTHTLRIPPMRDASHDEKEPTRLAANNANKARLAKETSEEDPEEQQDRLFLICTARKASMAGDDAQAKAIMQSLADLYPPASGTGSDTPMGTESRAKSPATVATTEATSTAKDPPATNEQVMVGKPSKGAVKGGQNFIDGVIPSHGYCGLPAFYNKNLKQLKGSVPLTIFSPIWQQQAATYASEKRAVDCGNTNKRHYTGHPASSEWSQSYAQWARNYQCFIKTLQEVYDYGKLADCDRIHQDSVDTIMLKHRFCAGLRYDLAIRVNTFQCDTIHEGKECLPDMSLYREEVATESLHDAKSRDETQFQENPYMEGGPRDDINPYTGRAKPNNNRRANDNNRGKKTQGRDQGNCYDPYSLSTLRGRNDSLDQSVEGT
ncbi:hypothetical protein PCANC_01079 [Puccinia coronata f. sp. avenae]|uniref:Uncharacterized protein n=1 Tax=Puccinia coronata f. sp. avenae TaxID=200324 RepID=A0A2N5W5S2_9BASI|nr:hypothetical protein PCASD_03082 [Puccinia coronata f. sp. avenae]PLW57594.1 hypothetical protein PCANC_01079 [Puccinia coronata f. sp. avenae]